jgi:hypothetical protein
MVVHRVVHSLVHDRREPHDEENPPSYRAAGRSITPL